MEITKENYEEIEPTIIKDIDECDFISIDLEFSGVYFKSRITDSPEELFRKNKMIAENYRIIEVGIVPFIKQKDPSSYIAKPYNIYVFPSAKQNNGRFDSTLDTIIFNREHGIDFNKWISHGVPYLNNSQLNKLTDRMINGNINRYNPKDKSSYRHIVLFKEADKDEFENFNNQFKKFYFESKENVFKYEKLNRHLILYFLNKCDRKIIDSIYIDCKDNNINESDEKSFMYIYRMSSYEEKKKKIAENEKIIFENLKKEKGIKNIFDKIISAKKPIVGHNCMIDILYIMNYFIDDIPKDYIFFKKMILNDFQGGIFDTKHIFISSNLDFENFTNNNKEVNKQKFSLEDLFKYLHNNKKNGINIEIPGNKFVNYLKNENSDENKKRFHQSDFDAFICGCSFIYMKNLLGEEFINKQKNLLNNFHGMLYPYFDLNNDKDNEDKYWCDSSDVYILSLNSNINGNKEMINKINKELLGSKLINYIVDCNKEIRCSFVVFISSENKNDFVSECSKYKEYINIVTLLDYKNSILANKSNK